MDTIPARLEVATERAESASEIMRLFANGPAGEYVETASGQVPTLAEWLVVNAQTLSGIPALQQFVAALQTPAGSTIVGEERYGGTVGSVLDRLPYSASAAGLGRGGDDFAALQELLNKISLSGGGELMMDTDTDILTSDTVLVKSNTHVTFTGKGYLKAMDTTSLGGILIVYSGSAAEIIRNVTINNARVDGNNLGYPGGLNDGENGVGGTNCINVRVRGGHIKNCRRGTYSAQGAGGKGVQFENGVRDIVVDSVLVEDCTVGFETGGVIDNTSPADFRSGGSVVYRNMQIRNCERLFALNQQHLGVPTSPDVVSVLIDGVYGQNCGREAVVGTETDWAPILLDRYNNAVARNVVLTNDASYGKINSVVRMTRGNNNDIDVTFFGECDFLANHASLMSSQGQMHDNIIQVKHYGTCNQYAIGGSAGESVASAENIYRMKTDVVTLGLIQPAFQYAGLFCEFTNATRSVKLEGPANQIGSATGFNNTYPTVVHGIAGTMKINGLTISFGVGTQVLDSADDIDIRKAGVSRLRVKSTGINLFTPVYADNAAAVAGGLVVGDVYRTAAGALLTRV